MAEKSKGPSAPGDEPASYEDPEAQGAVPSAPEAPGAAAARAIPSAEIRAVAADLRAGKIDAEGAVERLIDDTLARRVKVDLTQTARVELEQLLRDLAKQDPAVADKLKKLTKGPPK